MLAPVAAHDPDNMNRKVYFLAPTRNSPPDGPIALGNVIVDPRSPEIALNSRLSEAVSNMHTHIHETVEFNQSDCLELSSGTFTVAGIRRCHMFRAKYVV